MTIDRKPRLLVVSPLPDDVTQRIRREYDAILPSDGSFAMEEVIALAKSHRAEAILASTRVKFDAAALAALPEGIRIVATCSVGFDHIDIAAARDRGIAVTNTPDVLTDATADLAFFLLLAASRRAREYADIMAAGWRRSFGLGDMLGVQLGGKTLGIFGFGRIGQAVAKRARAFDMRIVYHARSPRPAEVAEGAEYFADFRDMLPHCQFLSLHAPATKGAAPVMNRDAFGLMPKGSVFVNTARGQFVDEEALLGALTSGHLFAAGLDVFGSEPDFDLRLRDLPNVVLTPHMGSATIETRNAMGFRALDNIRAVLDGEEAPDRILR